MKHQKRCYQASWGLHTCRVVLSNGSPTSTIELQKLNSQSLRETHHCQSPFQLASQVPSNTYKTVIDAVDGYHSIPWDKESQKLTTLITESGRYQYLRMPKGSRPQEMSTHIALMSWLNISPTRSKLLIMYSYIQLILKIIFGKRGTPSPY